MKKYIIFTIMLMFSITGYTSTLDNINQCNENVNTMTSIVKKLTVDIESKKLVPTKQLIKLTSEEVTPFFRNGVIASKNMNVLWITTTCIEKSNLLIIKLSKYL